jgi:hypothetical protein
MPKVERFWSRIDARGPCWEWTGPLNNGYGRLRYGGRHRYAHRLAWELLVGLLGPDEELDHLCRNRRCVNPDHLEPVSRSENLRRGYGACAQHARKTHCKRGHLLAGDNLYIRKNGARRCLTCNRAYPPNRRT